MVAKIDEQHAAVISLPVDPTGQTNFSANVVGVELGASVRAIGVHGRNL
jgi:hypothetical protein